MGSRAEPRQWNGQAAAGLHRIAQVLSLPARRDTFTNSQLHQRNQQSSQSSALKRVGKVRGAKQGTLSLEQVRRVESVHGHPHSHAVA